LRKKKKKQKEERLGAPDILPCMALPGQKLPRVLAGRGKERGTPLACGPLLKSNQNSLYPVSFPVQAACVFI
jgi:hypothetical protein